MSDVLINMNALTDIIILAYSVVLLNVKTSIDIKHVELYRLLDSSVGLDILLYQNFIYIEF